MRGLGYAPGSVSELLRTRRCRSSSLSRVVLEAPRSVARFAATSDGSPRLARVFGGPVSLVRARRRRGGRL